MTTFSFDEYQQRAVRTLKPQKALTTQEGAVLNWALGAANEAGELAGVVKHEIFHRPRAGHPFASSASMMELAKEVGDVLWYLAALCAELGISLTDCADLNLVKLEHRHGLGQGSGGAFSFEGSDQRHTAEVELKDTSAYQAIKRRIMGWEERV